MSGLSLRVVDLSHAISPDMPYYPGTEPPIFTRPCTLESHGFVEQRIALYSHTGTHMDAPAHILRQARTLDQLDIAQFVGSAVVLNLKKAHKGVIGIDDVKAFCRQIEGKDFVLLHTGWCDLWGTASYYEAYPVLSAEAAAWLAGFELKGIGADMISIDAYESTAFPIHKIFLEKGTVIIENLTNLEAMIDAEFLFCCLPLKIIEADGAPVRAVALLD